jgi:hypothetical protein
MGATHSTESRASELSDFLLRMETESSILRLKIQASEKETKDLASRGDMDAARAKFVSSQYQRKEQLNLLRTSNAVQNQISILQSNQLNRDAMRVLNSSVNTLHKTKVDGEAVDRQMDRLHELGDSTAISAEHLGEDGVGGAGDDAAFLAFLSGTTKPPVEEVSPAIDVSALSVANGSLPKYAAKASETTALLN